MAALPTLSRTVDPAAIGRDGEQFRVEASESERGAIAEALGALGLAELSADLELARAASGLVTATGRLRAALTQACVVTLEPVDQRIDQPIERRFVPAGSATDSDASVDIAPEEDELPEPYGRDGIDLGAFVLEEFVLAVDPYPRAPGAELPEEATADAEETRQSPFAVLKSLGHSGGT